MKKFVSSLLLASMLLQISACTAEPETVETDTQSESETVPVETRVQTKLPDDLTFDGDTFTTAFKNDQAASENYFADELSSDNMQAALYRRAKTTEKRLNVVMKYDVNIDLAATRDLFMSGDNVYQQYILGGVDEYEVVVSGYLYNTDTLPYIDTSADWWNQSQIDALRLGENTYMLVSDFLLIDPAAIFFNWDMIEDNNLPNPYTLVNEGTWTLDTYIDMCIAVINDMDGDGEYTSEDDITGMHYQDTSQLAPFFPGCGQLITERDEEGRVEMAMNNERTLVIWDKLLRFSTSNGSFSSFQKFEDNRALFATRKVSYLESYAGMSELSVGLVPFPKMDESQDSYYSLCYDPIITVPATIKNPELVGAVLEFLAWESGNEVTPTYYDKLLKTRYSADLETRAMVELLFDTVTYEVGITYFMFENGFCGLAYIANSPIQGDPHAASRMRFERTMVKKTLKTFYEELEKVESPEETAETAGE